MNPKKKITILILFISLLSSVAYTQNNSPEEITAIQQAIKEKNIGKVKELIAKGADVNQENKFGESPIETAIKTDQIEIVKILLSKGATSLWGMQYAAAKNNIEMVRLLINNNFDLGYSLIYAVENDNLIMVQLLLNNGAKVNISEKRRTGLFRKHYVSPIQAAVENSNKTIVNLLIDKGVPLSEAIEECFAHENNELIKALITRSGDYNAYVVRAFEHGDKSIIDFLSEHGADLKQKDDNGNTVLHLSATSNPELVKFCIEQHKLDVNGKNNLGETPLMLAVKENKVSIVSYLLQIGASVNSANKWGETALYYCPADDQTIFNILVQNGADVNHETLNKTTLLINAAQKKNFDLLKYLLENDAPILAVNDEGKSAFQYIVGNYRGNNDLINLFLDKGADINTKDMPSGKSLMYYAIESENLDYIKELMTKGATVNVLDAKGERPKQDDVAIIKFIIENGADINALDSWHNSFLCIAVDNNDLELAHYLVSKGINVNQNCYFDESPIIKAIKDENLVLVEFLADNNADVNAVGYFNRNVMEYAREKDNQAIIDFLKSRGAMTKEDRNELYRKSMETEHEMKSAINHKNEAQMVSLLKTAKGLVIQSSLVDKIAVFAAEQGNPVIVELLLSEMKLNIDASINSSDQNLLIIATINDKTSLVSYLINKGCIQDKIDSQNKKAMDYAESKDMRKIYKEHKP